MSKTYVKHLDYFENYKSREMNRQRTRAFKMSGLREL